ncbi:MAG: hypothetical protein ACK5QX_10750, partial [bacterium]
MGRQGRSPGRPGLVGVARSNGYCGGPVLSKKDHADHHALAARVASERGSRKVGCLRRGQGRVQAAGLVQDVRPDQADATRPGGGGPCALQGVPSGVDGRQGANRYVG